MNCLSRYVRLFLLTAFALPAGSARADYVLDNFGASSAAGSWRYSFLADTGHTGDINYVPTLDDAAKAAYLGLSAPHADGLWSSPGKGPSVPASELYVFETLVRSPVDRLLELVFGGDDGHSLYLDDGLVGGGGFGADIPFTLSLAAGVPRKLTVAVHNGNGPMVVGIWRQDDPTRGLQTIDDLQIEAPEPSTMALACLGLLTIAARSQQLRRSFRPLKCNRIGAMMLGFAVASVAIYCAPVAAEPPLVSAEGNFWRVPDQGQITGHSAGHPCVNCELTNILANDWWGPKQPIFADGGEAGSVHWIEWETSRPFFLTSFTLLALHDTPDRDASHRGFSDFRLYARQTTAEDWTELYDLQPANPYQFTSGPDIIPTNEWGYLAVHADVAKTVAKQFRAEFVQYGFNGPRVQALHGFGEALTPGDADLDGRVTLADFGILKANFAQAGKGWADGDFNGNTVPDLEDFGLLKANFGKGTAGGAAAVPEPAAWQLLAAGAIAAACGFKRAGNRSRRRV